MTQTHPITPPPELVQQWEEQWCDMPVIRPSINSYMAAQAAQWGADTELEACLGEIRDGAGRICIDETRLRVLLAEDIWTARRPKPPSLKEQARVELDRLVALIPTEGALAMAEPIRRALEALDD